MEDSNSKQPMIKGIGELEGHRFHIRDEGEGGVIVVDASRLLFLNETGFDYALAAIQSIDQEEVITRIQKKYKVSKSQIVKDYQTLRDKILSFVIEPDVDPISTFDFGETTPFSHTPTAPYRMDLALTYRCNNECSHCYVDPQRRKWTPDMELSTNQWRKILDTLLEIL